MQEKSGKERILAAARLLMLEKGFEATSIDEICEKAEVAKGTFFYHFENKEALAKATVGYHMQLGADMLGEADFWKKRDPLQRFLGYIDFTIACVKDPVKDGCLLGVLSGDMARSHPEIISACGTGFSGWTQSLKQIIEEIRKKYSPRSKINSESLAKLFISTFEGALILAKATGDTEAVKSALEHYKTYVKQQFTTK